jgi:hypothetical protein
MSLLETCARANPNDVVFALLMALCASTCATTSVVKSCNHTDRYRACVQKHEPRDCKEAE